MVPSRNGPKGAEVASFGLASLIFVLTPTQVGYQDLAALMAQQPAVAQRWRDHLIASPFGTIHAATFSLPRPVGTAIPEAPLVRLASLGNASDVTGSIGLPPHAARRDMQQIVFPVINRAGKGDRLVPSVRQPEPSAAEEQQPAQAPAERPSRPSCPAARRRPRLELNDHTDTELPDAQSVVMADIGRDAYRKNAPLKPDEIAAAIHVEPFPEYDVALSLEMNPEDRARGWSRARRSRSDRIHAERAAEPRRPQCGSERDAAVFRQRPVRHFARRHQAVVDRRGAGADDAVDLGRSRHEAGRARPAADSAGRDRLPAKAK